MKHIPVKLILVALLLNISTTGLFADDMAQAQNAASEGDYVLAASYIRTVIAKNPEDIDAMELGARIYLELGIHDTAVAYARQVYHDNDDVKSRVIFYGLALTESGQATEATVVLRKFYRTNEDVDVSLALVNALVAADSLKTAELVATTARNKYPKSASAYLALGNLYFNSKPMPVYELAVQNYNEALQIDSSDTKAQINLAVCYWRMGNRETDSDLANEYFSRSLKEWDKVTRLDPKNARAWFEEGKILYLGGRYAAATTALSTYRQLRPLGTGEIMASWYLGESLYKQNKCDSAKIHLDDAASRIDSLKPTVSLMMAKCSFQAKKWKECVDYYTASVPIKSRWESLDYWYFGVALVVAGDTAQAVTVMAEAADRDPKQCNFMFKYALLLQGKLSFARSTAIFRQRLENCSDSLDPKILVFIGNNFFADSLVDSASAMYERALLINPKYSWAIFRMGETSLILGDLARGTALLESVVATAKSSANQDDRRYANPAIARLNARDLTEKRWQPIIDRSKIGIELDAKSISAWIYLAVGYQGLQNVEEAKKAYKEVLKIDPSNETAKKNLKALGS